MNCEDLKFNLSFFLEDELTADEKLAVETHLSACPLCRVELAEYRDLSQGLKTIERPEVSPALAASIQYALRRELAISDDKTELSFLDNAQRWLSPKLLPYGVGTFASIALYFFISLGMLVPADGSRSDLEIARDNTYRRSGMAAVDSGALAYASERADVSQESPSLNPNGALVAAMSAMASRNGHKDDGEIVLVANVFSDGIARISEVVQPAPDEKTMRELEKAMEQLPETNPAFVPAQVDKRSDVVQIVLKIHEVNVSSTDDAKPVRKLRAKR
jgi:hypothetical protein